MTVKAGLLVWENGTKVGITTGRMVDGKVVYESANGSHRLADLNSIALTLNEGAEHGDLRRLVEPKLGIDAYRSKMGDDKDVCVVSFTVFGKEPALDLTNFTEKSYDWVLDADVSSGEASDGNYVAFVELERDEHIPSRIMEMMEDLMNLTAQKVEDWTFTYYKGTTERPLDLKTLQKHVITSPEEYEIKVDKVTESAELNSLRAVAGIPVQSTKIIDPQLLNIQIAAGIK